MSDAERNKREFTTSAELRSYVEGELETARNEVFAHAGLIDDKDALSFMNTLAALYESADNMPYDFENTKLAQMLTRTYATETATQAVKDGNISQMKYITGLQNYNIDASSITTLIKIRNRIEKDAYIQYLYGHMGNGKTDFALLQAELAYRELGYDIVTNIKSFSEREGFTYVRTFGDLMYELTGEKVDSLKNYETENVETDDVLFLFDEGSSSASGYSGDAYETQEKLGKLTKLIRKIDGNLIIIGHTGKDVHPDIRRITTDCVSKVSKKTAEYYKSVDEQGNGVDLQFTISSIQETNFDYDTKESAKWSWELATNEEVEKARENAKEAKSDKDLRKRNLEIAKLKIDEDLTNEQLADRYDLSPQRIGQILNELRNEAT